MKNDPDIIRWSQLKRFLKHTCGWIVVYGIIGLIVDVTKYSDQSTTTHIIILVALSIFMAFVTMPRDNW